MVQQTTPARDQATLKRHYDLERELADRLRAASAAERRGLYRTVYDEFFRRAPDHPQHKRKYDPTAQQARTQRQLRLLGRFLAEDTTYLEIGAGDCHLATTVAERVRHVYAVEVSEVLADPCKRPRNLGVVISDGVGIDVPPESVTVAYSHMVLEHLHPEDAVEHIRAVYRALAPGGIYICMTLNRLSGPGDISSLFDDVATGFHLKEYTVRELRAIFRDTGFNSASIFTNVKGRYFKTAATPVLALEAFLDVLPRPLTRRLTRVVPLRLLFRDIIMIGQKSL